MRVLVAASLLVLSACSVPTSMTVFVPPESASAIKSFFGFLPEANATVVIGEIPNPKGVVIELIADLSCGECYSLDGGNWNYRVHAGNTLGLQYGLAELLEGMNFRFFHPWEVKAPARFASPDKTGIIGPVFKPQMSLRGLHLHTLHPIESYFAFWETTPQDLNDARRVLDWTAKNRGNYVEWCALNNIVGPGQTQDDWRAHTAAIITEAHARGMKVGLGIEMFGTANLQQAFDVFDTGTEPDPAAVADQRLGIVLNGLPWDTIDISFGEFSGADPNQFLTHLNTVYTELQKLAPGTTLTATIHLDGSPSVQVTYDGQTLPYYFLVQFADPHIVPWIHSVMYYDLFEPTAGAYLYDDFSQHLGYLQARQKASQPVGYYPESAYWIDFDDSVPTYLPVYMHSRWLDMHNLSAAAAVGGYAQLDQHVEFSSGWEWGYWQNDYATLRMNWGLPGSWGDEVQKMYAPFGDAGKTVAGQIVALGELQDQFLIQQKLGAYLAGRDSILDVGATMGDVSQPPRVSFSDIVAMTPDERTAFVTTVLEPLTSLQVQTANIAAAISAAKPDLSDPWMTEVVQGVAVDNLRSEFAVDVYSAVTSYETSGSDDGSLAKAQAALAQAQTIIQSRHANLHYPVPSLLTGTNPNATLYQYGYLYEADQLCYWQRELIQATNIIMSQSAEVPACILD